MNSLASGPATIVMVGRHDPLLEGVIDLWKPERKWLGFFPRGAFEDYARMGGIHAALDQNGQAIGYIAVRVSSGWTHIAHLCVAKHMRRSSMARRLVDHIAGIAQTCQHLGIRLKCRRDFPASRFWPQAGFYAGRSQAGRGESPTELLSWIRRNPNVPDLFPHDEDDERKLRVAILDANVFYDLAHEDDAWESIPLKAQESLCLAAGWVRDAWDLGFVDELWTEIHRHVDSKTQEKHVLRTSEFRLIPHDEREIKAHYELLENILGWKGAGKTQRQSDMRHVAKAAASVAEFFVTRDEKLLAAAELIAESLPIRVVSPAQFLSLFDEEEREHLYSPARLLGTAIVDSTPKQAELDRHSGAFLGRTPQEPAHHFRDLSRRLVALSAGNSNRLLKLVADDMGSPVLLRSGFVDAEAFQIELLRTAPHGLAPTTVRHFLLQAIQQAATSGMSSIRIGDPYLSLVTRQALAELNFTEVEGGWVRFLCSSILPAMDYDTWPDHVRPLPTVENLHADAVDLEARFWPVKIEGAEISCASVTIKEHWAAKLFDCDLAGQELFPVDPARVFNRENIFYRSPRNWPTSMPKRILWYVSGTKTFRACSRLLNVAVGPAAELFRRYGRLGIYEWKDIEKLTGGDRNGKIMALHIADTEIFDVPVSLSEARAFNVGKIVIGAHPVCEESFLGIYSAGFSRFHL